MSSPRILLFDIETAPNLAHVWGLWQQNVAVNQIIKAGYVLCWAAKWYGERKMYYHDSRSPGMLKEIHGLLNEADFVVHYNGAHFDIPTLSREFVLAKMEPPAPFKQVDLLRVVREQFNFPSNKLEYVVKALGVGRKMPNEGHELWIKCMAGDAAAWRTMEKYNKHDTALLEPLYDRLKPWIKGHPNHSLFTGKDGCPNCGSGRFQSRGVAVTLARRYQRFQCSECGRWFRGVRSLGGAAHTGAA